jgi:hypothetical protein
MNLTWPDVAFMGLFIVFIFGSIILMGWLAKYWNVFGDEQKPGNSSHPTSTTNQETKEN